MVKTTITEIAVDRDETIVVRYRRSFLVWCPVCSAEVVMVRPEEAAATSGSNAREIYRLVEAGAIHFQESSDGTVLVCLDSLTGSKSSGVPHENEHDASRSV